MPDIHRFSDFAAPGDRPLAGPKERLDSLLGEPITVLAFRVAPSRYRDGGSGRCATVQFSRDASPGEIKVFFTGSSVLIGQLETYRDKVPFGTVIQKVDRFYTFT